MQHRRDLSPNQQRAGGRGTHFIKIAGQKIDAIERIHVADKLCCQTLIFEYGRGELDSPRFLKKATPGASAGAFQIDAGNPAVSRPQPIDVKAPFLHHLPPPNRALRLSSPVLNKVETIALTMRLGLLLARYCARHSTELPEPFGLTSSIPT